MPPKKKPTGKKAVPMAFFRNLYLYLVCGITIVMILIASISLVKIGLDTYIFQIEPESRYWVNDCQELQRELLTGPFDSGVEVTKLKVAECEEGASERAKAEASNQRKRDVSEALAMLLVTLPLYWFHWRTIQKDHKK